MDLRQPNEYFAPYNIRESPIDSPKDIAQKENKYYGGGAASKQKINIDLYQSPGFIPPPFPSRMRSQVMEAQEVNYAAAFGELRGLVSDLLNQLLSSCIFFENLMMEGEEYNSELLQTDGQLVGAIETLFKIREILIFYTKKLVLFFIILGGSLI